MSIKNTKVSGAVAMNSAPKDAVSTVVDGSLWIALDLERGPPQAGP